MRPGPNSEPQAQQTSEDPGHHPHAGPAPDNVTELTRHGLQRFQAGDFEAAARIFQALVGASPSSATAWNQLSLALVSLGRHDEAASALARSLEISPAQPAAWTSLASALLQLDRFDEADEACGAALALDADQGAAWQVRALALSARNDFAGAAEAFARAIALEGESAGLCANRGAALLKCGQFAEAARALSAAAALDPAAGGITDARRVADLAVAAIAGAALDPGVEGEDADRLYKTALLLLDAGAERFAAVRVAQAWAERRPANVEARHLRDAALARPVDRQPPELVAQRFDEMAEAFDEVLVERLGYDGPGELAALLAPLRIAEGTLDILDLGCGTGLCALVLRPFARRLVGVDLSPGMLARATQRSLYDVLERRDLVDALAGAPSAWDLIAAMDAFPYLGDLETVFVRAADALRPGGWFAFSTEHAAGEGFVLQGNGRYVHGAGYIRRLAAGRFEIVTETVAMLRREAGRAVDGGYHLLRRAG